MGGGIWSMHFIAMLAFRMPMPVGYDLGLTVLSLIVAVAVTVGRRWSWGSPSRGRTTPGWRRPSLRTPMRTRRTALPRSLVGDQTRGRSLIGSRPYSAMDVAVLLSL
jgi:hypothetical protein